MKGVFWKPKEKQNPKMSLGFQFDQYLHIMEKKRGKCIQSHMMNIVSIVFLVD